MKNLNYPELPGIYWLKINSFLPRIKVNLYHENFNDRTLSVKYKKLCVGDCSRFLNVEWKICKEEC